MAGVNWARIWPFRPSGEGPATAGFRLRYTWGSQGVTYWADPYLPDWPERWAEFGEDSGSVALLVQAEELGHVEHDASTLRLSWPALFTLLAAEAQGETAGNELLTLLKLPTQTDLRPALSSQGSLEDAEFRITLGAWTHPSGVRLLDAPNLNGAIITSPEGERLLTEPVWRLVQAVGQFYGLTAAERSPDINRRSWGLIRRLALTASVPLTDFLQHTVVLTPETLSLTLIPSRDHGSRTLQVEPRFEDAPARWLETFDRFPAVPNRYDIPDAEGIIQVLVTPEVRTVLQEIRRWPARIVAGQRAEAFVRNPYAALGEAAAKVIDADQFEQAREAAGIAFERFSVVADRDAAGMLTEVGILVETTSGHEILAKRENFANAKALEEFTELFGRRVKSEHQCFVWEGYELEILGDAERQLAELRDLLNEWRTAALAVRYADIFDLGRYSERIEGFGRETPYVSPFIARRDDEAGWIPENVVLGVIFTPEGLDHPVGTVLNTNDREILRRNIVHAEQSGMDAISIPGVDRPVSLGEARRVSEMLETTRSQVQRGEFEPQRRMRARPSLVLKTNIDEVDYRESRTEALRLPSDCEPRLPKCLRPEVSLKHHQRLGVAWLQHLWSLAPVHCRGALLADDMGLGKTLQILTFVTRCMEDDSSFNPALIVAPVSLLENWREEIEKFFLPKCIPILTLYGQALAGKKLANAQIDPQLLDEGVVRLLTPGWLGEARLVQTGPDNL